MKLITGAGVAAGALVFAAGTSVAALSQTATADSPLGATTSTTSDSQDLTDFDAAEIEHLKVESDADETGTDETGTDDAGELGDTNETEDSTDGGAGAALGQAHAAAMRAWAQCVADAASGPKTTLSQTPPKLACGVKPAAPGRTAQLTRTHTSTTESDQTDSQSDDTTETDSGQSAWGAHASGEHTGHHTSQGAGHHGHHD